jgi:heme/copper-type cytochrome/quinol oxidase subunit 2
VYNKNKKMLEKSLIKIVYAQGITNPLEAESFAQLVDAVTEIIMTVGLLVAVLFIIWSGFLFVTARGDENQLKKAKATFMWTVIGVAILLGSTIIAQAVVNFVQGL